jgi:hypothetical protein
MPESMRIASLAVGIGLYGCGVAAVQDADLIQNAASRQTMTLSGEAIVDPPEAGDYDCRYRPRADGRDELLLGSGCPRLHSSATKPRKPPDLDS